MQYVRLYSCFSDALSSIHKACVEFSQHDCMPLREWSDCNRLHERMCFEAVYILVQHVGGSTSAILLTKR